MNFNRFLSLPHRSLIARANTEVSSLSTGFFFKKNNTGIFLKKVWEIQLVLFQASPAPVRHPLRRGLPQPRALRTQPVAEHHGQIQVLEIPNYGNKKINPTFKTYFFQNSIGRSLKSEEREDATCMSWEVQSYSYLGSSREAEKSIVESVTQCNMERNLYFCT